ncbi:hypothetical protein BGW39_003230 [Mortierella sp. 14UC]|nr:hypothetical protein BGW39_003230 [Mortierella sp. 14UC]
MGASPIFDDQSLGAIDLQEEQDILQFLVERAYEDADYTKLLLWTVYKSKTEGIVNQSTENAACILEMAGIHFQPPLQESTNIRAKMATINDDVILTVLARCNISRGQVSESPETL